MRVASARDLRCRCRRDHRARRKRALPFAAGDADIAVVRRRVMLRGLSLQFVDEVLANVLLHRFLWFRRAAPVRGPRSVEFPALFSGELHSFYSPHPIAADLEADRVPFGETDYCTVWDCRFASETTTG